MTTVMPSAGHPAPPEEDEELLYMQREGGAEYSEEDAILDEMMMEEMNEEERRTTAAAEGVEDDPEGDTLVGGERKRIRGDASEGPANMEGVADDEDAARQKRQRTLKGRALLLAEVDEAMPRYVPTLPRRIAAMLPVSATTTGACADDGVNDAMEDRVEDDGIMSVTSDRTGDRVYVAVGDNSNNLHELYGGDLRELEKRIARVMRTSTQGGMLSRSIAELTREIMQERQERNRAAMTVDDGAQPGIDGGLNDMEVADGEADTGAALLVDRYAPKTFTELLSDERTNREVLFWMKQWDPCVFGKAATAKIAQRHPFNQRNDIKNTSGHGHRSGGAKDGGPGPSASGGDGGRPARKVLLLSGAPGWGKTTLAHVVATHCGYRVVEVNASDDRTESSLKRRILDAVQMRPGVGTDRRPNCLVLDEIDGAANAGEGRGAIQALLSIIKDDEASGRGGGGPRKDGDEKGRRKKKVERLNRPIICICNDLYAPALRPLREVAQIYRFSAPSIRRMATRLRHICEAEGMQIEPQILRSLADYSNRDVRSSLNTLQLVKRSKSPSSDLSGIIGDSNGRKDVTQGASDLWKRVFHSTQRRAQRGAFHIRVGGGGDDDAQLYRNLENLGEHGLVLGGCFHNYINMNFTDPRMTSAVDCLDWMGDADVMMGHAFANANFQIQSYLPANVMAVRRIAAVPERPFIEWPSAEFRAVKERAAKLDVMADWRQGFDADVSVSTSASTLQRDVLPYLMRIISPQSLRVTSPQLMTSIEKRALENLVDTMIRYNVSYRPGFERQGGDEAGALELHPPVHTFHAYESMSTASELRPLGSEMKQILSHHMQIEKINRSMKLLDPGNDAEAAAQRSASSGAGRDPRQRKAPPPSLKKTSVSEASAALVPKAIDKAKASTRVNPMMNLFQRAGLKPPTKRQTVDVKGIDGANGLKPAAHEGGCDGKRRQPDATIRYKFQEGFSAAVRRRVKLSDLLQ